MPGLILGVVALFVSSRGGKWGYVVRSRHRAYRALRRKGMTKKIAAMIANRGDTFVERSAMARKGARKRRRR